MPRRRTSERGVRSWPIQRNPLLCCRYPRHGKVLMTVLRTIPCQHREVPPDPPSTHRSSLTLAMPVSFPCALQAQLPLRVRVALGRVCWASSARRRKIRLRVLCKSIVRLLYPCQVPLLIIAYSQFQLIVHPFEPRRSTRFERIREPQ